MTQHHVASSMNVQMAAPTSYVPTTIVAVP